MIVQADAVQITKEVAAIMTEAAKRFIEMNGRVVIGIVGGRSVAPIYAMFGQASLSWPQVHILLLDERLVPPDHPDSNFRLAFEALGSPAASRLVSFCTDSVNPKKNLQNYNEYLAGLGGRIDIILVSSGEDGHIASLFPGHPGLAQKQQGFILIADAPKPPPERMSAGIALLHQARLGLILFMGPAKKTALAHFFDTAQQEHDCPAKIIATLPTFHVFTDLQIAK
jgi:6-phosphogluconolactonase